MRKKLVDFIVIMNIRVYTHDEHLCIHMYVYIHVNNYLRGNGNEAFNKYMEQKRIQLPFFLNLTGIIIVLKQGLRSLTEKHKTTSNAKAIRRVLRNTLHGIYQSSHFFSLPKKV